MRYIYSLAIVFFGLISSVSGQTNFNDYQPLQCQGPIPEDFLNKFKLEAIEDLSRLEDERRKVFKARQSFILSSYESIGNTLKSGEILFGDQVSTYLSGFLDKLLSDKPKLRKELRIYASRSLYTNAYCTHQGIIIVNLGFLAKIKTESELAFVLQHEVAHYTQNHLVDRVVERVESTRKAGYKVRYYSDIIEDMLQRSQKDELECDSIAATYFNAHGYDVKDAHGLMDLLMQTHLPFDETPFDIEAFNDSEFKIPSFFRKDYIDPIDLEEEKFDKYSTHPNVRTRKKLISKVLTTSQKNTFNYKPAELQKVREIAKFETVYAGMYQREYGTTIYLANALLKKYPNSKFLKSSIAYSLYGLSKYATLNDLHKAARSTRTIQGESQQTHNLFRQLRKEQINALAIHQLHKYYKEDPTNEVLMQMIRNLILDMPKLGVTLEAIQNASPLVFDNDVAQFKSITDEREKLKASRNLQKKYSDFYLSGLRKDFENRLLVEYYNEALEEQAYEESLDAMDAKDRDKYDKKKYKNALKNGLNLKDKKIYFLEPTIIFQHNRFASSKNYLKNLEAKKEFMSLFKSYVKSELKIDHEFLTTDKLKPSQTDHFNNVINLQRWASEKLFHSSDDIIPLITPYSTEKIEGMEYVCGVTMINYTKSNGLFVFYVANVKTGETKYHITYYYGALKPKQAWSFTKKHLNVLSK